MTVRELLHSISSDELADWQAFERVHGPLGREYQSEALASINDALSLANKLLGCQLENNPVPDPDRYIRPAEAFERGKQAALDAELASKNKEHDEGYMTQAEIDAEFARREA